MRWLLIASWSVFTDTGTIHVFRHVLRCRKEKKTLLEKQKPKTTKPEMKSEDWKKALVSTVKMFFIIGRTRATHGAELQSKTRSVARRDKCWHSGLSFSPMYTDIQVQTCFSHARTCMTTTHVVLHSSGDKKCSYIKCKCDAYCGPKYLCYLQTEPLH